MNGVGLIAIASLCLGCTSTRFASRGQLSAIESGAGGTTGDGMVVRTRSRWKSRLDPTSHIRFQDRAGRWSDWISAAELFVADGYVYTPTVADALDHATRIRIQGLEGKRLLALQTTRPAEGASLELDADGTATVVATRDAMRAWMHGFLDAIDELHRPGLPLKVCSEYEPTCSELVGLRAARHIVQKQLDGEPYGTWEIELERRAPITVERQALLELLDEGLWTRHGWRWEEVAGAEIEDFSGAKTLGAIAGASAAAIVVVPVALLAAGIGAVPGRGGPGRGRIGGSSGRSGTLSTIAAGTGGTAARPRGTWRSVLADDDGLAAPSLFSAQARRRANVQLAVTTEAAATASGEQLATGAAATLLVRQVFEIGAGGLYLQARGAGERWHGGLSFFRIGARLPLDAAHRWSVKMAADVGGGGGDDLGVFARLQWGAHYRFSDRASLGITPWSPTLLNWKRGGPAGDNRRWTYASGLELGLAF